MKFEEENYITIPKYELSFVYFLIKDGIVVYVGQTKRGLQRPFSHFDKDFDEIKIIYCEEKMLKTMEDKFIVKYDPYYNHTISSSYNYNLKRARNTIREYFNCNINIPTLRRILENCNVKTYFVDYKEYVSSEDLFNVIKQVEEEIGRQ